ncbi:hypothetical protein Mmc1_1425 [Magnetococcus marinus MC-1]|uniref:Uncharacterized protein n=1 Tax=Magnetococcus marinus (strain ATCC BAA-1437 / JCM 17883 / MC-1) TaxID=156889 RepID=A0L7J3_MAGMM|nr:hypothetical protein Mmc1_1425 [Magnetococcus marinus MC-1]
MTYGQLMAAFCLAKRKLGQPFVFSQSSILYVPVKGLVKLCCVVVWGALASTLSLFGMIVGWVNTGQIEWAVWPKSLRLTPLR